MYGSTMVYTRVYLYTNFHFWLFGYEHFRLVIWLLNFTMYVCTVKYYIVYNFVIFETKNPNG